MVSRVAREKMLGSPSLKELKSRNEGLHSVIHSINMFHVIFNSETFVLSEFEQMTFKHELGIEIILREKSPSLSSENLLFTKNFFDILKWEWFCP